MIEPPRASPAVEPLLAKAPASASSKPATSIWPPLASMRAEPPVAPAPALSKLTPPASPNAVTETLSMVAVASAMATNWAEPPVPLPAEPVEMTLPLSKPPLLPEPLAVTKTSVAVSEPALRLT